MQLLVFGASGGTGREIVGQALARGVHVTAFVRDPARLAIQHANLRVVQGDVADTERVALAVEGQDVVLSALGVGTPLKSDPAVIDGVRNVVSVMHSKGVRRLVYLSFIGVSESRADAGWIVKHVAKWPLRHEIADHEIKEELVKSSGLDWTIVRPPKLTNGPRTGQYRTGDDIVAHALLPTLSRADVADFMLRVGIDSSYVGRATRVLP